jgi:hypothetical protein
VISFATGHNQGSGHLFDADNDYNCDVCDKNAEIRDGGFYACMYADIDCDFDCCPKCYNAKIVANEESKDSKPKSFEAKR